MPCVLSQPGTITSHHCSGTTGSEADHRHRCTAHHREDYKEEGVPEGAEQPHATAAADAGHLEEGKGDDMPGGSEGFRRKHVRGYHRRRCSQPGGGTVPEENRVPVYRRIWGYGVCTYHRI